MIRDAERAGPRPGADGSAWHRLATVSLALLVAAIVATGCGDDEAATEPLGAPEPGISEITSDPAQYVGQSVELRGEVSEIFFLPGGFLLDESDGGGDDLIVYDMILPLGVGEGDEVEVRGTVRLVDQDFREEADDQFFDDFAFDDVQGQAAIDASSIDPTASDTAAVGDFDTLDANGDSYLDNDEIAERADATGVFEDWDADADSELDRDEIAGNAFGLWDRDGNQKISEEEWETATKLWYPEDPDLVVFDDADGDGDSEVDADEFTERFDFSALGEEWNSPTLDKTTFKRRTSASTTPMGMAGSPRTSGRTARPPSARRLSLSSDPPRGRATHAQAAAALPPAPRAAPDAPDAPAGA